MKTHFVNIPIFIPELACPFQCVFCNQQKISGQKHLPNYIEIEAKIKQHLSTINRESTEITIAFFGGSFTALPFDQQRSYLSIAQSFRKQNQVDGIRLSTRPDYITKENLKLLQDYGVTHIELGAQSLDETVLHASGRGHNVSDVENASKLIIEFGFFLGLQMMIGLPKDNIQKSMATAEKIAAFGAAETRIYPCLIIEGTQLHTQYQQGKYQALSLQEAVEQSALLVQYFRKKSIKILRLGLHPSTDLEISKSLVAGPFHPSFFELVETQIWKQKLQEKILVLEPSKVQIMVNPSQLNYAKGYRKSNELYFAELGYTLQYAIDNTLQKDSFYVGNC